MLTHLHISNYALIDNIDIEWNTGFTVITGETGAGKSILLGALGMLLGGRADVKMLKSESKKCIIEGRFNIGHLQLKDFFESNDIDFDEEECIIRREISANGKSRTFINDTPISISKLKEISTRIVDIHSQHQNLLMGDENFILSTIDTMADNKHRLLEYQNIYAAWQKAKKELEQLNEEANKSQEDFDYFQFQLQQLKDAQLEADEQENLEKESERLNHAEEIKTNLYHTISIFNDDEISPLNHIKSSVQRLENIAPHFSEISDIVDRLQSTRIELQDIIDEIDKYVGYVEFDPSRMDYVNDRLSTIYQLQKKHHVNSIGELLEIEANLAEKVNHYENIDAILSQKEKEVNDIYNSLLKNSENLTLHRKESAKKLTNDLCAILKDLGMPSIQMAIQFTQRATPERSGSDKISFLFSSNKDVPMQEVSQIASGGEIARLMLALKSIIARHRYLPTIIFDEIDTGVSGVMAEKMAKVMMSMSNHCQVICITHLPQIAAFGSQHYKVFKIETEAGTSSHLTSLTSSERVEEIAKMLSGEQLTEAAINNAKSLLKGI